MKDKEVLQKAIDKAIKNGYKPPYKEYWRHINKIFSHNFAKAFWGEQIKEFEYKNGGRKTNCLNLGWQQHLQQMVLEENPINYLRKFINTEKSK